MKPTTFWLVWCPEGLAPPNRKHPTEKLAKAEAERLAKLNRPRQFYVLRATHMSAVPPPPSCVTYTLNARSDENQCFHSFFGEAE